MDVSIVIPCYNSGMYLNDALQSIAASKNTSGYSCEVIIVDDGSTDKQTTDLLARLAMDNYIVLHQENKGPGAARNTGIKMARGKYILFLDSDNKIRDHFIETALHIFNNSNADIVYGQPAFFGSTAVPRFKTREFDLVSMLIVNHIDVCSMVRKSILEALGGFDEDRRLIAFEDWELWIRAGAAGHTFHFVRDILFDYRITNHSLLDEKNHTDNHEKVVALLYQKHNQLVLNTFRQIGMGYSVFKRDEQRPFRTFLKMLYYKYLVNIINIHAPKKQKTITT